MIDSEYALSFGDEKVFDYLPLLTSVSLSELTPEQVQSVLNRRGLLTIEGTVIRVVFNPKDEKWMIMTRRKNAFQSFWTQKASFGRLFCNELPGSLTEFTETLDRDVCYFFLIPNRAQNVIAIEPSAEKQIYFIGYQRVGEALQNLDLSGIEAPRGTQPPPELVFTSLEELENFILEKYEEKQAIGVVFPELNLKVCHPTFLEWQGLRGDEPNLSIRFLQLEEAFFQEHSQVARGRLNAFIKQYKFDVEEFKRRFSDKVFELAGIYYKRYIKGKYIRASAPDHQVLIRARSQSEGQNTHKEIRVLIRRVLYEVKYRW